MEVLHTEIQALQKLLFHIHQVRAKQAHWARSYIRSAHKKINVSILLHYILPYIQLVGGEGDSSGSESVSSSPRHGRSPLRNTTLMAVQSALSKHQKQTQVQQKCSFLTVDVRTDVRTVAPNLRVGTTKWVPKEM